MRVKERGFGTGYPPPLTFFGLFALIARGEQEEIVCVGGYSLLHVEII